MAFVSKIARKVTVLHEGSVLAEGLDGTGAERSAGDRGVSRTLSDSAASTVTVSNLNQYYGGSHILRDLTFDAPAGKVTALLGRNGVGKSTLLRTLMGLVPAKSGQVAFRRQGHHGASSRTSACEPASATCRRAERYFRGLPSRKTCEMGLASRPRGARIPERIFQMFPVLRSMLRRRGGDLSGGQQQQLAIGRALAIGPRLLILDEPTEGIQPSIIKDIERAIRTLAESGEMAILLVEQYYDFARSLADQYLVMERGEIVARGAGARHGSRRRKTLAGSMTPWQAENRQWVSLNQSSLRGKPNCRSGSAMRNDRTVLARKMFRRPAGRAEAAVSGRR